jgi:hypothetical protein
MTLGNQLGKRRHREIRVPMNATRSVMRSGSLFELLGFGELLIAMERFSATNGR